MTPKRSGWNTQEKANSPAKANSFVLIQEQQSKQIRGQKTMLKKPFVRIQSEERGLFLNYFE